MSDPIGLREHLEALRVADEKFQTERDRRYAEVKDAEEKALKIKEESDKNALELARQIQTYKDQQHNGLLTQLDKFVAGAATKDDLKATEDKFAAALKPLNDFVQSQTGVQTGKDKTWQIIVTIIGTGIAILGFIGFK